MVLQIFIFRAFLQIFLLLFLFVLFQHILVEPQKFPLLHIEIQNRAQSLQNLDLDLISRPQIKVIQKKFCDDPFINEVFLIERLVFDIWD